MTNPAFVSVVAPLHDDEDIVEGFVEETLSVLHASFSHYELILVDDGSKDETSALVRMRLGGHPGLRYIRLSRSFGQETAIAAGLDAAIGDYVIVMLPATDPPHLIPGLLEVAEAGPGNVYGVRDSRQGEGWFGRLGSWLFFRVVSPWMAMGVPHDATHLRVLSRQAVDAISRVRARNRYLRTLAAQVGFSSRAFRYTPEQRRERPRRKGVAESFRLAIDIIASNSTRPLRAVSVIAAGTSALSLVYAFYVFWVFLFMEDVAEGWVSLTGPIAVLFCVLFAVLAVVAEYLGQMFEEVKHQPMYHVEVEDSGSFAIQEEELNVVAEDTEPHASGEDKKT